MQALTRQFGDASPVLLLRRAVGKRLGEMGALNLGGSVKVCGCPRDFQEFMQSARRHGAGIIKCLQEFRVLFAKRTVGFDLRGAHLRIEMNAAPLKASLLDIAHALHRALHGRVFSRTLLALQGGKRNSLGLGAEIDAVKQGL